MLTFPIIVKFQAKNLPWEIHWAKPCSLLLKTSHPPQQIIVTLENQSLTPDISFIVCLLFFSFQDFTFQDTISGSIFMHFFTLG